MPTSRDAVLADPRSGARPLGNSDPGSGTRTIEPTRVTSPARNAGRAPAAPSAPRRVSSPSAPSRSRTGARRVPNYGRTAQQFSSPDFSNYQGVILAEFVVAELLVAATPIATSKSDASSGQYMSPYVGQDMVKMLSIGFLYFLLELTAVVNSRAGRLAAWFGGLILIVVGLNEASTIAKVFNIFGGLASAPASVQAQAFGQTPATVGQDIWNAVAGSAAKLKG